MKTTTIAMITAVILIVIGGVYFITRGSAVSAPTNQSITTSTTQTDSSLTSALNDLDNTDLNSIDSELNQNDTDTSSF